MTTKSWKITTLCLKFLQMLTSLQFGPLTRPYRGVGIQVSYFSWLFSEIFVIWHPLFCADKTKDATATGRYQDIIEAYQVTHPKSITTTFIFMLFGQVLSDPMSRQRYDFERTGEFYVGMYSHLHTSFVTLLLQLFFVVNSLLLMQTCPGRSHFPWTVLLFLY